MTKSIERTLALKTESIWQEFCLIHPRLVRSNPPKIELNNRFRSRAADCVAWENTIRMSAKFLVQHEANMLAVILPHEIAHQIDYNFHGIPKGNRWHGPTWQNLMVQYGLPPDTYHSMKLLKV